MRLLDLFVTDLIGRDSKKARVFMNQSQSFRQERVVTMGLKSLLLAAIIVANLFFIFCCILFANSKGDLLANN